MKKLISYKSAKEIDNLSQDAYLIPSLSLMESAAREFYSLIKEDIKKSNSVLFVAGSGNNGADALAVARMAFCDGFENIKIFFVQGHQSKENLTQLNICKALNIPFVNTIVADLVIDGLIGVGFAGVLSEDKKQIVDEISKCGNVISIDCPSGLREDGNSYCVKAKKTITFGYEKIAFYVGNNINSVGTVIATNPSFPLFKINIEENYYLLDYQDIYLPPIDSRMYKNKKGHVAIVGGSSAYTGAIRLSERSAFKAGAGLVSVFTSDDAYSVVASENLSPIVKRFSDLNSSEIYDSLLIGPGLVDLTSEEVINIINLFSGKCVVVDAGAINMLGERAEEIEDGKNIIITPHVGEFRALMKTLKIESTDELRDIKAVSKALKGATVIKKSSNTIIFKDDNYYILAYPNPALGVAGSGDVLAGITAVIKDPIQGVLLHSLAGKNAYNDVGFFTSEELILEVGKCRSTC